jgi:hypothetical protein
MPVFGKLSGSGFHALLYLQIDGRIGEAADKSDPALTRGRHFERKISVF